MTGSLKTIWAFMDSAEDGGIVAALTPLGPTPLVTGSLTNLERFRPLAEALAKEHGRRIELREYKVYEVKEIFDGSN